MGCRGGGWGRQVSLASSETHMNRRLSVARVVDVVDVVDETRRPPEGTGIRSTAAGVAGTA